MKTTSETLAKMRAELVELGSPNTFEWNTDDVCDVLDDLDTAAALLKAADEFMDSLWGMVMTPERFALFKKYSDMQVKLKLAGK